MAHLHPAALDGRDVNPVPDDADLRCRHPRPQIALLRLRRHTDEVVDIGQQSSMVGLLTRIREEIGQVLRAQHHWYAGFTSGADPVMALPADTRMAVKDLDGHAAQPRRARLVTTRRVLQLESKGGATEQRCPLEDPATGRSRRVDEEDAVAVKQLGRERQHVLAQTGRLEAVRVETDRQAWLAEEGRDRRFWHGLLYYPRCPRPRNARRIQHGRTPQEWCWALTTRTALNIGRASGGAS